MSEPEVKEVIAQKVEEQSIKVEDRKVEEFFKGPEKYSLLEFFKEENGNYSSMRLAFLLFSLAFVFVWTYVSIRSNRLSEIPVGVQAMMLILIAGKGYQKLVENGSDGKNALEKLIRREDKDDRR